MIILDIFIIIKIQEELVWKLFTIKDTKEFDSYVDNENILDNYSKKLKRLSQDKEYCQMVWDERIEEALTNHDLYVNAKDEGIYEGRVEGALEKEREMVINMHREKISLEIIAKCTNLSIDDINKIIKSNNKSN